MVVSVLSAAGVVTTTRAAAADPAPYVINVNAPAGTKYSWAADQMNFHWKMPQQRTVSLKYGTLLNTASSGNKANAMIFAEPDGVGHAQAYVGVALRPNVDRSSEEWAAVKDRPVMVKVTTKTYLMAIGDDFVAAWGPGQFIRGSATHDVREMHVANYAKTETFHTTLSDLNVGIAPNQQMGIWTGVSVEVSSVGPHKLPEYATATTTVKSIELTFLPGEIRLLPT
jgi:hypothetical protein